MSRAHTDEMEVARQQLQHAHAVILEQRQHPRNPAIASALTAAGDACLEAINRLTDAIVRAGRL